jgi:hypothetical protein
MLLSGTVGYTLLENSEINKTILILADIHDQVKYCEQKSIMIDNWLGLLANNENNEVLLEEVVREDFKLSDLWPNSIHTRRLQHLNQNNTKIIPIDIRPLLIPFSWETLNNKNVLGNVLLKNYLNKLDSVYNFKSTIFMKKYTAPQLKRAHKNCSEKVLGMLLDQFFQLRTIYLEYKETNKDFLDKPIIEIYNIDINKLEEINNFCSSLMEWYTLLLILNNNSKSIIHLGLAHSNRIMDFLIEVYKFKLLKMTGVNTMAEIINENDNNQPSACVMIPTI